MITASRYRSPTREAYAEVSLSEFDTDELREELANREDKDDFGRESFTFTASTISRLATLALCGQRDIALQEVCQLLESRVGRLLP